jgi:hypothetical protein
MTDKLNQEGLLDWTNYRVDYSTSNPSLKTKGFFTLTSRGGAVTGTRTKTEHNGNPIPPETDRVDGFYLDGRLKMYREIPASNVVQIYVVTVDPNNQKRLEGRYYNIGANNDAGQITMVAS